MKRPGSSCAGDGMKIAMIIAILTGCALLMPALVRTPEAILKEQAGTDPAQPH